MGVGKKEMNDRKPRTMTHQERSHAGRKLVTRSTETEMQANGSGTIGQGMAMSIVFVSAAFTSTCFGVVSTDWYSFGNDDFTTGAFPWPDV